MKLQEGVQASATFGEGEAHRYRLERWWSEARDPQGWMAWVMLNPSTATAEEDDATIRKCQKFARREGYDGIVVTNLFALRSRNPKALKTHPDPIGPLNDAHIQRAALETPVTVAAWGTHGRLHGRGQRVLTMLEGMEDVFLTTVTRTGDGMPGHPLYVKDDAPLVAW